MENFFFLCSVNIQLKAFIFAKIPILDMRLPWMRPWYKYHTIYPKNKKKNLVSFIPKLYPIWDYISYRF